MILKSDASFLWNRLKHTNDLASWPAIYLICHVSQVLKTMKNCTCNVNNSSCSRDMIFSVSDLVGVMAANSSLNSDIKQFLNHWLVTNYSFLLDLRSKIKDIISITLMQNHAIITVTSEVPYVFFNFYFYVIFHCQKLLITWTVE